MDGWSLGRSDEGLSATWTCEAVERVSCGHVEWGERALGDGKEVHCCRNDFAGRAQRKAHMSLASRQPCLLLLWVPNTEKSERQTGPWIRWGAEDVGEKGMGFNPASRYAQLSYTCPQVSPFMKVLPTKTSAYAFANPNNSCHDCGFHALDRPPTHAHSFLWPYHTVTELQSSR